MSYVFCNQCGHRNPPTSRFCSSCGAVLDSLADHTVTIAKIDPLFEGAGPDDDVVIALGDLPGVEASLVLRNGGEPGSAFALDAPITHIGRHQRSDILLDDITVSRRHAEVLRTSAGFLVRDTGSLNGTYVNNERIDEAILRQGDEVQVGKFRLIFFEMADG